MYESEWDYYWEKGFHPDYLDELEKEEKKKKERKVM